MKKKIIALCLIVALAATAVIGGTLAYFTDTDSAKNTFTVGGVSIQLIEQQTSENGLVDFVQEKPLVPGKSNDGNAQSKIVTVKNTGENDAWVWVDMLIPSALLNPANPTDQSKNALHYNEYGAFSQDYWNNAKYSISASNSAVTDGVFKASGEGFVPTNEKMVNISAETVWTNWQKVGTEKIGEIAPEQNGVRQRFNICENAGTGGCKAGSALEDCINNARNGAGKKIRQAAEDYQ